jgi:predicted NAD/FAD-binding protein
VSAQRETVAVVGSGVAGLTAAYALSRTHDVTLFESDDRFGGHAHTHDVLDSSGRTIAVDSGFIVHNRRTYPTLLKLFAELDVPTQESEMTMSVHCDGCGLEYAGGGGLRKIFGSPSTANPRYLRMLLEVTRFHRQAHRVLASEQLDGLTLGGFLELGGYSDYFVRHFMLPFVSAVWSAGPATSLQYPAKYLFTFLANHGLLSVGGSPAWRTVTGGSRTYVEKVTAALPATRLSTGVRSIRRHPDGVEVTDVTGATHAVDQVVVATHADTALGLLADPTPAEQEVLGAFGYSHNETLLHRDTSLLPTHLAARAAWNYRMPSCTSGESGERTALSYDMNVLERLQAEDTYVVTLNQTADVDPASVIARMDYTHPVYTLESVAAQGRLPELNDGRTAFAGAYHGWGFHEDGCLAGARAAASLGSHWSDEQW